MILLMTCSMGLLFAVELDANQANEIARQFFSKKKGLSISNLPIINRVKIASPASTQNPIVQNAPYYIFNYGYNNGFVLVAGDDMVQPILGYSDSGSFPETDIPAHVQALLDSYQKAIENITVQNEKPEKPSLSIASIASGTPAKSPILGDIRWGQNTPFNLLTPYDETYNEKTPAGCVAVAMSQIMRYHAWPNVGTGQKSYTSNYGILSADFANAPYQWDEMLSNYNATSTPQQDTAVATILYHTGIAVKMNYNPTGSGANNYDVCYALKNYFKYDQDLQLVNRNIYTQTEWQTLLENEINANRPVFYSAQSGEGGHAFVCDGYDSNGFYHINWGWNGYYNGYFELMTLSSTDPESTGETGGFSSNHQMIVGIQKPDGIDNFNPQIGMITAMTSSNSSVRTTNPTTTLACLIGNYGCNTFSGNFGFGFIKEGENNLNVLTSYLVSSLSEGSPFPFQRQVTLSALNTDGTYYIYPIYKPSGSNTWNIVRGSKFIENVLIATRSNKSISIQRPSTVVSLTVVDSIYPTILNKNKINEVSVTIENNGIEYHSYIGLQLYSESGLTLEQTLTTTDLLLPSNQKKTFHFKVTPTLSAGTYTLRVLYDKSNNYNTSELTTTPIQVTSNTIYITSGETDIPSASNEHPIYCSKVGQRLWIQSFSPIQKLELYDHGGNIIQQAFKQNWMDVSDNMKGIYLLRIWTNGKILVEKIQL